MSRRVILSVDDSEDDHFLLERAFRKQAALADLMFLDDGQAAIDFLMRAATGAELVPDLILLDLKMPRRDGFAVLDWLRQQSALPEVPVAVFTSSQRDDDIERAYRKGAAWYVVKPVALSDLLEFARRAAEWTFSRDGDCLTKFAFYRAPQARAEGISDRFGTSDS